MWGHASRGMRGLILVGASASRLSATILVGVREQAEAVGLVGSVEGVGGEESKAVLVQIDAEGPRRSNQTIEAQRNLVGQV